MFKEEALQDVIENGPELMVYFFIDQIGAFSWRMNHEMAHGRIEQQHHAAIDKDIERAKQQQVRLVKCLPRFGVEKPLDESNRATEDYWKWYRWWSNWHKNTLTNDEWDALQRDLGADGTMTQEQIEKYRPEGDWRETPKPEGETDA